MKFGINFNKNKKEEIKKDPLSKQEKKEAEWKNKEETHKILAEKFSELITDNPIVVYSNSVKNELKSFDKIERINLDESGTGGIISVTFSFDDWVAVDTNGFRASNYFDGKNDYYKISKESLSNIIRMMNELVERSGYSEQEKEKMSKAVFDNFKNKIIETEIIPKSKSKVDSKSNSISINSPDKIDPDYVEPKEQPGIMGSGRDQMSEEDFSKMMDRGDKNVEKKTFDYFVKKNEYNLFKLKSFSKYRNQPRNVINKLASLDDIRDVEIKLIDIGKSYGLSEEEVQDYIKKANS